MFFLLSVYQVLGENGYFKLRAHQKEVSRLEKEVQRLAEENQRLERQIQRLRSDPAAVEQIAREEMKLVRPGEVIYALPSPPQPAPAPPAARTR